jgi:hypothetical protein
LPLCQPSYLNGYRRHEVGDLPQGGEDIVGPNRRGSVLCDQCEYRTLFVLCGVERDVNLEQRSASIKLLNPTLGPTLDLNDITGKELVDGALQSFACNVRENELPYTSFKSTYEFTGFGQDRIDDVETGWHRVIKLDP